MMCFVCGGTYLKLNTALCCIPTIQILYQLNFTEGWQSCTASQVFQCLNYTRLCIKLSSTLQWYMVALIWNNNWVGSFLFLLFCFCVLCDRLWIMRCFPLTFFSLVTKLVFVRSGNWSNLQFLIRKDGKSRECEVLITPVFILHLLQH